VTSDNKQVVGALLGMDLTSGTGGVQNYGDLRTMYGYDGDSPSWAGTDFGDPHLITGRMYSGKWPGLNLVHCDLSPTDRSDDPDQPRRCVYHNWAAMPGFNNPPPEFAGRGMECIYRQMMWPGGIVVDNEKRFQRDAIHDGQPYGAGADAQFIGPQSVFSVGGDNWDLKPGEEVNMIEVSAVGGFPYQEAVEMGQQWIAGTMSEQQRLTRYFTLEDSLFTIFRRSQDVIEPAGTNTSTVAELEAMLAANVDLQSAPANPSTFTANSSTDKLELSWTEVSGVDGYRIYRTTGNRLGEQPWVRVASESDLGPTATSHSDDMDVQVGVGYFYYIVSVKNGYESGSFATRTAKAVSPVTTPAGDLSDVYVVPNPWNWRYQNKVFVTEVGNPLPGFADQVTFHGIVGKCTIHIFTLDGVEIKRIEHEPLQPGPGLELKFGTEVWDLKTDGGQPVVSGIYIYVVDDPANGTANGKIVVIR